MKTLFYQCLASLLIAGFLFATIPVAAQTILYNETSGDLPNNVDGPVFTISSAGTFQVKGTLATPADGHDHFQIGIPPGFQITNIAYSLTGGSINGGVTFGPYGASATQGTGNLSLSPYTAIPSGTWTTVVFANFSLGSVWSVTYTVTTAPIPASVTTQPIDQSVCEGSPVTFESGASGTPTPTVQWQQSTDDGNNWADIPGATSADYTFTPVAGNSGYQYSAVYTNIGGEDYSYGAILTVNTSTQITQNPGDQSALTGSSVTFSSGASGSPAPYPQWQVSTDNGDTYNDISGENSPTLTFNTAASDNGNLYHVSYDNTCAFQISTAARLSVSTLPVTISSFNVKKINGNAMISWTTQQESNCKGFEILYSNTGANYIPLKWIDGHGSSSLAHTYTFTQNKPAKGNNYYRLKQVDYDGREVLSDVKVLSFLQNNNLNIFPNPVTDQVEISSAHSGTISITDLSGKEVSKRQSIQSELYLNLKNFAPGIYIVHLITEEGTQVKKLFKN